MHKSRKSAVVILIMAALMTLSIGAVAAPSASATTGCYATSCTGHDPTTHGCSASSTTSTSGALATVWNRYSIGCDANWARGQLTTAALNAGDTMQVMIFTIDRAHNSVGMCWPSPNNDQGYSDEFCNGYYGGSSMVYTDMVDGTNVTEAYVMVVSSSGNFLAEYEADQ